MRASLASALLVSSLLLVTSASALGPQQGQIVRGKYTASGSASVAGVRIQYLQSKVNVTGNGRIKGRIVKTVMSGGRILSQRRYNLKGTVSSVRKKGRSFIAPARISISDGVRVHGQFQGLVADDQRLSRYFSGKIGGASNSSFVLRTR
jgi:hypothetical protein